VPPLLFDAVVFDLDGTLVATERFWVPAARTGTRRAFAELGIERPIPSAREWMGLVGRELAVGIADLLPDLGIDAREAVLRACVEEEHRTIAADEAPWMPGARDVLEGLRSAGVRTGIASNCSAAYLEQMWGKLGLEGLVDEGRSLDSAGIVDKADMIEDLLGRFDTRSAVMVGDRAGDRDAAWANGIPHVHCAFGYAADGEEVRAEGRIEDPGELVGLLGRRADWIAAALERAGVGRTPRGAGPVVGVTGAPLSGKTLFARDAARALPGTVRVVSLDEHFRRGDTGELDDLLGTRYDLESL